MNILHKHLLRKYHPEHLEPFEKSVYSQNGEDGVIEEIFARIGTNSKYAVEFGVEDGKQCNTRVLKENGWKVLQMDGNDNNPKDIKKEFITAKNINNLFKKYRVPKEFDLLHIDIDSADYWVYKSLSEEYKPRVLIFEYNASLPASEALSVPDSVTEWDLTTYFGASLLAFYSLAKPRGYELVYCERRGVNAFFVRSDCMKGLVSRTVGEAFRGPSYGDLHTSGAQIGHRKSTKNFVKV